VFGEKYVKGKEEKGENVKEKKEKSKTKRKCELKEYI
jgi:hypothetical protein